VIIKYINCLIVVLGLYCGKKLINYKRKVPQLLFIRTVSVAGIPSCVIEVVMEGQLNLYAIGPNIPVLGNLPANGIANNLNNQIANINNNNNNNNIINNVNDNNNNIINNVNNNNNNIVGQNQPNIRNNNPNLNNNNIRVNINPNNNVPQYGINNVNINNRTKDHNRRGWLRRMLDKFKEPEFVNYPEAQNIPLSSTNRFDKLIDEVKEVKEQKVMDEKPELIQHDYSDVKVNGVKANIISKKVKGNDIKLTLAQYTAIKNEANNKHIDPLELRDILQEKGYNLTDIDDYLALDFKEPTDGSKFSIGIQTTSNIDTNIQTNLINTKQFKIPTRKIVNKINKKLRSIAALPELTYHLKTKYFMCYRNINLVNNLVRDARIWMLNNNYKLDNEEDYYLLTQSVMAAYTVDEQELKFRQIIKNVDNYDNMIHLNETLEGKIRTNYFNPLREKRGMFSTEVKLPQKTLVI